MMRALVTGGAGFIGCHLVRGLLSAGWSVRVIDDLSVGKREDLGDVLGEVDFIQASILAEPVLDASVQGCDAVFHLAAISSVVRSLEDPEGTRRVNLDGTIAVARAAQRHGARLVFSSSAAVYGDTPEPVKTEGGPTAPLSPYGLQKLEGERAITALASDGLAAICLRYFNVYGPGQKPENPYSGVLSIFTSRALAGSPIVIHGDGGQTRDFVAVEDVVRANLIAAGSDSQGVYNVATGDAATILSVAKLIIRASASASDIRHDEPRLGDIRHSVGDPSRAHAHLGFRCQVDLDHGLERLVASQTSAAPARTP